MPKGEKIKYKKYLAFGFFVFIFAAAFLFLSSNFAWAQSPDLGLSFAERLGLANNDPRIVIMILVRIALTFIGIIAVVYIMYAGFLWMTSAGSEEKVSRAKKILVNAIIGLIIILSAFLIVSFVINRFGGAIRSHGNGTGVDPGQTAGGLGAIGNCAIETVYPEPYQDDVPRNTSIIVTFREAVRPESIMENNHLHSNGSVKIFITAQGIDQSLAYDQVMVTHSADNKTFVFTPVNYLGSPSETIRYSVHLANSILNSQGLPIFRSCGINNYFEWNFVVSNLLDLLPPQVLEGGVFPAPDNAQDEFGGAQAQAAEGTITVNSQPQVSVPASVNNLQSHSAPNASIPAAQVNQICQENGDLQVTVSQDNISATLSRANGGILLGSAVLNSDNTFVFPSYFALVIESGSTPAQGNYWTMTMIAAVLADTLTIGNTIYTFVPAAAPNPTGEQIPLGSDRNATAANIAGAVNGPQTPNPNVSAGASGNVVSLTARTAGASGNNIVLITNNPSTLALSAMAGGSDRNRNVTMRGGRLDKPRNSIIQVNFNEGINPVTVSGTADEVQNAIQIVNAGLNPVAGGQACTEDKDCRSYRCNNNVCAGNFVAGKFIVSNIYRTVEFISDNLCGVNGCGEQIYCLPENSNLRVDLDASAIAPCLPGDNCAPRTPYNQCVGGHCENAAGQLYPLSATPLVGVADLALNSLDGNRNTAAAGPVNFYNQNAPDANAGDSFQWSFFISDIIDLTSPVISITSPAHNQANSVSLSAPVEATFNKVMMSGSLRSGSANIFNGRENRTHKLINIWNYTNNPVGYWIASRNLDVSPSDGEPDGTVAEIRHSMFADSTSYRSQVGSGVKDIYQNCFKPSSGPGCTGLDAESSCCPEPPPGSGINPWHVGPNGNCEN